MSRMALAATSLVAAIPAGILAFLAIMALLSSAGDMGTLLLAVTGGATLSGILVALMPAAILVGKRKPAEKPAAKAKKADSEEADASGPQTAEMVADDLSEEDEDTEELSGAADLSGSTGEFEFEDDAFLDEDDDENP